MVLPHNGGGFNHQYTILTIKQQQLTYINLEKKFDFCKISVLKKNMSFLLLPPYTYTMYEELRVFFKQDFIFWPVKLYQEVYNVFTFTEQHVTCF